MIRTHKSRPVIVAAVEHQVGALRRFKLGVGTVLADQQTGRMVSSTIGPSRVCSARLRDSREIGS
jgi:hypothetical protein